MIRDILLLAAVCISLPICFMRPFYGVLCWTFVGFFNPQAFCFGVARTVPIAEAIAIPTILGFLGKMQFRRLFCKEVGLIAILWLWFTFTTWNSESIPVFFDKVDYGWFRWGFVSKILLMTVLMIGAVGSRKQLRWLLLTIAVSFGLLILHAVPGIILSGGEFRVYGPDNSMIADNNAFGLATNMALPFFFFLAKTGSARLRWFLGVCFIFAIPVCLFTYSRGALVGLIAISVGMLLLSNQRLLLIPIGFAAVFFFLFLAPQKLRDRMSETTDTRESSAQQRFNAWTFSWNLAKDYPATGGGFEPFTPSLYQRYAPNPKDVHGPHSIYFGVLAEHGFPGFCLYFLLVGDCFLSLHRIVKRGRRYGDDEAVRYANVLRFSLIGFLTSGLFLGHTYFDFYFSIVACVAVLRRVCREDWEEQTDDEGEFVDSGDVPVLAASHYA
jgi:probable O-glycosylation ligase (exosortase A-associated)